MGTASILSYLSLFVWRNPSLTSATQQVTCSTHLCDPGRGVYNAVATDPAACAGCNDVSYLTPVLHRPFPTLATTQLTRGNLQPE